MKSYQYEELNLSEWKPTRDSLQLFTTLLGKIKQQYAPEEKHFWHYGLYLGIRGITTQPLLAAGHMLSVMLDFQRHSLKLTLSEGQDYSFSLENTSIHDLLKRVDHQLKKWDIPFKIDRKPFSSKSVMVYDKKQATTFWQSLSRVGGLLQNIKSGMHEETSPIQVFPHHFDLSLTWFSGRLVPNTDQNDLDISREQMGFGFSTGDEAIKEAYFYVTAYPKHEEWHKGQLPQAAQWQTTPWKGAVLLYNQILKSDKPDKLITDFYQSAWQSGRG